jgi:hypothetical protein
MTEANPNRETSDAATAIPPTLEDVRAGARVLLTAALEAEVTVRLKDDWAAESGSSGGWTITPMRVSIGDSGAPLLFFERPAD